MFNKSIQSLKKNALSKAALEARVHCLEKEIDGLKGELIALRQKERLVERMLDVLPMGAVWADINGDIVFGNNALATLFGYPRPMDVIGLNIFDFVAPPGKTKISAVVLPALRERGKWSGQLPVRKPNGAAFSVIAEVAFVENEAGKPDRIVAAFSDTSVNDQLESQLRQAQKMEAVGTLAGGIAHDMNNVLTAIINLASVLRLESEHFSDSHKQDMEDILYAARRGRDLSKDLLGFARKGKYLKQRMNLNDVVEDVLKLLRRTATNVELKFHPESILPYIEGDHGQISHALMNICLNGAEAITDRGVISIFTETYRLDGVELLAWPELSAGRYVKLDVIDDGEGMDEQVLEHVFDPFFSTKETDRGTGLGLSMVYGTVKSHSGAISIKSTRGVGTKVTILFPVSTSNRTPMRKSGQFVLRNARTSGKLLLVDDEQMIRRSATRLFSKLGYDVICAANGMEAVEEVKMRGSQYSIVILDLIMPVMDGETAFQKIREIDPGLPVLIASGYSKGEKVEMLMNAGAAGFVQKPFELKMIASEIASVMRDCKAD